MMLMAFRDLKAMLFITFLSMMLTICSPNSLRTINLMMTLSLEISSEGNKEVEKIKQTEVALEDFQGLVGLVVDSVVLEELLTMIPFSVI